LILRTAIALQPRARKIPGVRALCAAFRSNQDPSSSPHASPSRLCSQLPESNTWFDTHGLKLTFNYFDDKMVLCKQTNEIKGKFMHTVILENIYELNSRLEEIQTSLQVATNSDQYQEMLNIFQNNLSILHESTDAQQTIRFIKLAKDLSNYINENDTQGNKLLETAFKTAITSLTHFDATSITDHNAILNEINTINRDLYLQTMSEWINNKKIPLSQLSMTKEELIELAPKLTYVNFDRMDIDDTFLNEFLQQAKMIEVLSLKKCHGIIHGLQNLSQCEKLKKIKITNCYNFNSKLPNDMPNLTSLSVKDCNRFNEALPANMPELTNFHLSGCNAFNQPLPANMPKLTNFYLSDCKAFDQPLPDDMPKLEFFNLLRCKAFNEALPANMPELTVFRLTECIAFDQPLPTDMPRL
jgi:hypothetical protein